MRLFFSCALIYALFGGWNLLEAKSFAQRITMDSSGAGVGAWTTDMGSYNAVKAATFTSSGVWSSSTQISAVNEDADFPLLASTSAGDSVVVWSTFDTTLNLRVLKAATLPFGGSWSSPVMVSSNTENLASFASNMSDAAYRVVINSSGVIMAIWNSYMGNDLVVRSARFSSGSWSTPVTISP